MSRFKWGVGWLIAVRFIQGLGEGPIVSWHLSNWQTFVDVWLWSGALHARAAGQVGSATGEIADGRPGLCRRTVRNNHLDAHLRSSSWELVAVDFLRLRLHRRRLELSIFMDRLRRPVFHTENLDAREKLHQHSHLGHRHPRQVTGHPLAVHLYFNAILRDSLRSCECKCHGWLTEIVVYIHSAFQMAQNYGYEFLMTELPTYMRQILRFSIKEVIIEQLLRRLPN